MLLFLLICHCEFLAISMAPTTQSQNYTKNPIQQKNLKKAISLKIFLFIFAAQSLSSAEFKRTLLLRADMTLTVFQL